MVMKDLIKDTHGASAFNTFHINGKTHISSSVYSEVIQTGSAKGKSITVLDY